MVTFLRRLRHLLHFRLFFTQRRFVRRNTSHLFQLQPLRTVCQLPILRRVRNQGHTRAGLNNGRLLHITIRLHRGGLPIMLHHRTFRSQNWLRAILTAFEPGVRRRQDNRQLFGGLLRIEFIGISGVFCKRKITLYYQCFL